MELQHCIKEHVKLLCSGEVGGYMGLLIGASALTLLEFFDLIVYNTILKCMEKKRRSSVQSFQSIKTVKVQPVDGQTFDRDKIPHFMSPKF